MFVFNLLTRTLGEQIEIKQALEPDIWLCEADVSQLENAIVNLAINARDAMPNGGKLIMETANVTLDEEYTLRDMDLQPGDIQLVSNHSVLHARTEYEEWPEPERKRHLLRLWLSLER